MKLVTPKGVPSSIARKNAGHGVEGDDGEEDDEEEDTGSPPPVSDPRAHASTIVPGIEDDKIYEVDAYSTVQSHYLQYRCQGDGRIAPTPIDKTTHEPATTPSSNVNDAKDVCGLFVQRVCPAGCRCFLSLPNGDEKFVEYMAERMTTVGVSRDKLLGAAEELCKKLSTSNKGFHSEFKDKDSVGCFKVGEKYTLKRPKKYDFANATDVRISLPVKPSTAATKQIAAALKSLPSVGEMYKDYKDSNGGPGGRKNSATTNDLCLTPSESLPVPSFNDTLREFYAECLDADRTSDDEDGDLVLEWENGRSNTAGGCSDGEYGVDSDGESDEDDLGEGFEDSDNEAPPRSELSELARFLNIAPRDSHVGTSYHSNPSLPTVTQPRPTTDSHSALAKFLNISEKGS